MLTIILHSLTLVIGHFGFASSELILTDTGQLDCGKIIYAIYPGGQELPTHKQWLVMSLIYRGVDRVPGEDGLAKQLSRYSINIRTIRVWKTYLSLLIETGWVVQIGRSKTARYQLTEQGDFMRRRAEAFYRRIYNEGQLRRDMKRLDEKTALSYVNVPPPEIRAMKLVLLNLLSQEPITRKELSDKLLSQYGIIYSEYNYRALLSILKSMRKKGWIDSQRPKGESTRFWITDAGEKMRIQVMKFYYQNMDSIGAEKVSLSDRAPKGERYLPIRSSPTGLS